MLIVANCLPWKQITQQILSPSPSQNSTQVHPIFPVPIRLARIRIYSAQPEILIINVKLFAINVSLFCESLCVFASSDRPNCYFSFLGSRGTFSLPPPLLSRHFHSLFCNGEEEKWEGDLRSSVWSRTTTRMMVELLRESGEWIILEIYKHEIVFFKFLINSGAKLVTERFLFGLCSWLRWMAQLVVVCCGALKLGDFNYWEDISYFTQGTYENPLESFHFWNYFMKSIAKTFLENQSIWFVLQ